MQIRIEATDLPGRPGDRPNVHVGVQRRGKAADLLGLVPADAPSATWELECAVARADGGFDVTGPYVQGPPRGRFVYLSWVSMDGPDPTMFRRTKLMLDAVPPQVLGAAVHSGLLVARLGLTDAKGRPLAASVRPPLIEWSAG